MPTFAHCSTRGTNTHRCAYGTDRHWPHVAGQLVCTSPISSIRTSRHVPARPRTAECACVSLCILEVFVLLALVAGAYVAGAVLAVASRHTKGLDCIRQHGHITTRYIHVSRCHKIHSCISFHVIVFGNMVTSPQDTFMHKIHKIHSSPQDTFMVTSRQDTFMQTHN